MDIKDIRKEKLVLEQQITDMLVEFENRTGLSISGIDYKSQPLYRDDGLEGYCNRCIVRVSL